MGNPVKPTPEQDRAREMVKQLQGLSGKDLDEVGPKAHVAEVVHHGEKLILPEGMGIDSAIDLLQRRKKYLGEKVVLRETFEVFPWDGAYALDRVLTKMYGWSPAIATQSMWGPRPPQRISIEVAAGKTEQVTWGAFSLPNVEGQLTTDTSMKNGHVCFALSAEILRKDEETVKHLFEEMRVYLKDNSIYRGKAIKVRFKDEDGDTIGMPEPTFIRTEDVDESMLVYSKAVRNAIETNLFTPILRVEDCVANGIPVKRGVLLGGSYGTGKTLAAKVAAKLAVRAGLTFVYVARADELKQAIEFGMLYQNPACVVFCEDIDRSTSGERTTELDDILNIIDGIDSKSANVITVLTTNHMDNINPAMLRPGRLDAVIEVTPPDAEAVQQLLRVYGGSTIAPDADLTEAGKQLAGQIPAVIAEVVKRAKLAQLRLQAPGTPVTQITGEALTEAAVTMGTQLRLMSGGDTEQVVLTIDTHIERAVERQLGPLAKQIRELHANLID